MRRLGSHLFQTLLEGSFQKSRDTQLKKSKKPKEALHKDFELFYKTNIKITNEIEELGQEIL